MYEMVTLLENNVSVKNTTLESRTDQKTNGFYL